MAAEDLEFQQNTEGGPGTDLNQGEAGAVNANLPTTAVSEGEMIAGPEVSAEEEGGDLEMASPEDYEPAFTAEDEDEDFLVSETTRPDESILEGIQGLPNANTVTPELRRALPSLVAAANAPGASQTMKVLVRFLAREANK